MNEKEQKLIEFALRVLNIMQDHEEWSSDTVDEICDEAYSLKLAETDPETGLFRKKERLLI